MKEIKINGYVIRTEKTAEGFVIKTFQVKAIDIPVATMRCETEAEVTKYITYATSVLEG